MKRTIYFFTLLLMVTFLITTGCNEGKQPVKKISAKLILSKSSNKMQAVKSFHFKLNHNGGSTPITMGVEMNKAEGDIIKPDKLKTTVDGTAMGTSIQVKLVTADGKTLMTNPLNNKWEVISEQFKVLSVFDPSSGIAAIIKGIKKPENINEEKVEGKLCFHLKGDIAPKDLNSITGSTSTIKLPVKTEVWIEKEGFLMHKVKLKGKITQSDKKGIIRTLSISNFNKDVNIKLPK